MMMANVWHLGIGVIARWGHEHVPQLTLRWQNRRLFESPASRALRALVLCTVMALSVLAAWYGIESMAQVQSPSVQLQQHVVSIQQQSQVLNSKNTQVELMHSQWKANQTRRAQQQIEMDDLRVAWPNSNLRQSMLSRLQKMANQRGLQVLDLKSTEDAAQHGFESSSLRFSVRGSEGDAQAYWQALNQLFQNGLWVSWVFRLLPNGQYALEGQLQLLWDTEDAFTDTGVEMLDLALHGLTTDSAMHDKGSRELSHVLADQNHQSMRVVGSAIPGGSERSLAAWIWIQSGTQIQLVQSGQWLGLEKLKVGLADAHGLWLTGDSGQPATQLGWEVVKP